MTINIAGGKHLKDCDAVARSLDKVRAKYNYMVLVHIVVPGVEKIAAQWAERNDELLNLLPKGVIAFPGSGITDNLIDKAKSLGIPVMRAAA